MPVSRKGYPAFPADDLLALVGRARAAGVEGPPINLEGYDRTYFYDPSGNRPELTEPKREPR